MLHRLSRTLCEIHRLSCEAPVADFQGAAFEAAKDMIRFESGYWGGLFVPEAIRRVRDGSFSGERAAALFLSEGWL